MVLSKNNCETKLTILSCIVKLFIYFLINQKNVRNKEHRIYIITVDSNIIKGEHVLVKLYNDTYLSSTIKSVNRRKN